MRTPHYPSYKDLDAFIDVERLKALDGFVRERVTTRLGTTDDLKFDTGPFVQDPEAERIPGPRMVHLSRSLKPDDYYNLDVPDLWKLTEEAEEFAPLMDFIDTLPFAATGRMLIIYDESGRAVTAHRDHDSVDLCHEFIWFRTSLDKPFYMLDHQSGEKLYVASFAAWFDTVNQFHGADETGKLSFSIRVDGVFTDAFRKQIPFPAVGKAAAPAIWAQNHQREGGGPVASRLPCDAAL